jgi:hypothetical protein
MHGVAQIRQEADEIRRKNEKTEIPLQTPQQAQNEPDRHIHPYAGYV